MCMKALMPALLYRNEPAQTFVRIHTGFIPSQLVHTVHIKYQCWPLILLGFWLTTRQHITFPLMKRKISSDYYWLDHALE